jgi:trimeric autotransporter adhesin
MNPLIQFRNNIVSPLVGLMFGCFGLLPTVQAVVPAPDGGYPGGNTAEGQAALLSLTTGGFNTAVGFFSLRSDTTGAFNTATGAGTLLANTANNNTATGAAALLSNTIGIGNTADGFGALVVNTTGGGNTAIGTSALRSNTDGDGNTAVGDLALQNNTTGMNNTVIGTASGANIVTASGVICIGAFLPGENVNGSCYIGSIFGQISNSGTAVLINADGKLGTPTSSRRFKDDIKPMDKASELILALRPVTFHYKKEIDPRSIPQFGLVAEDVEKVNPDLVVRDKKGKPYSVRYDQVNAMLLNEFLKEHRKVEEMQKQIEALTAGLQKVSAQLELSKAAPQTVLNNQ